MEISNLLDFTTRAELRGWLDRNHSTEKCCWVIVSLSPKPDTLLYLDVVEEALCYGWIDGIKKRLSDNRLAQRLSPRARLSNWTELNKERVRRLERLGLMTESGRNALPDMDDSSFRIHPHIENRLKACPETYSNFLKFPDLYKRIRLDTIQSVQNDHDLFEKRLDKFLKNTKLNKMYGKWNDDGRLINY